MEAAAVRSGTRTAALPRPPLGKQCHSVTEVTKFYKMEVNFYTRCLFLGNNLNLVMLKESEHMKLGQSDERTAHEVLIHISSVFFFVLFVGIF
jgi:hypothetical protein